MKTRLGSGVLALDRPQVGDDRLELGAVQRAPDRHLGRQLEQLEAAGMKVQEITALMGGIVVARQGVTLAAGLVKEHSSSACVATAPGAREGQRDQRQPDRTPRDHRPSVRRRVPDVFTVRTRDPATRARTGSLHLAHGEVSTPAFVPLATRGAVKTLEPRDVADLGYEMVLGNTFHLMLAPGPELVAELGGLNEMMRWPGPIITDSGGFQVFSMGYGTVTDEIKSRPSRRRQGSAPAGSGGSDPHGAILAIEEEGVRFRSYLNGGERFIGPETSMAVQAALGSDIALVFDECTPFHVSRDYIARSMQRTHRWLERCLAWHEQSGPPAQTVYGIVQGGTEQDLRLESTAVVAASRCDGIAIGGSLGQDKAQMYEVVDWSTAELDRLAPDRPRHLLGIGEVDDLIAGVAAGIDTFDCAMPTRLARHGMALVPDPAGRWRVDLMKGRVKRSPEPILDGCPCPACSQGFSRAYLHYLLRAHELTGLRLVTLHNLSFIGRLMSDLRAAIDENRLAEVSAALLTGAAPGATSCTC
jgi:queuine tRNA-ribosyltransferase